jgi:cytochrome c-type biogenesis protein CcmH
MRIAVLALALVLDLAAAAETPTFQELEESLTCQCGCGLTVHSCNHLQCPSAIPLRQEIREQMALGLGKDAVLAHFSAKYGEKILSAPTTSGFNLTAWVMPFVAVAAGVLVVVFTLVRWRRAPRATGGERAASPYPIGSEEASELEKVMQRELEEFDRFS